MPATREEAGVRKDTSLDVGKMGAEPKLRPRRLTQEPPSGGLLPFG